MLMTNVLGMRYWYPFTEEATDKILEDGINRLVIIPLYPQVLRKC
jgi:ferrochelatase